MIKIIFFILGWMTLGWYLVEKRASRGYYDIFDEWARDHNYVEQEGDWLKHTEVQAIVYAMVPFLMIGYVVFLIIRKIRKSLYDKR